MKKPMEKIEKALSYSEEINDRDAKFRKEINDLFERGDIDGVRDKLKQYRQFLLKYHNKKDVEEILFKYYQKLET